MGQRPVNSLDSTNRMVSIASGVLSRTRANILATGWWFNTEYTTLSPSAADSRIYLPNDYLGLIGGECPQYVMRGRQLYDTLNGTGVFTDSVTVQIVRSLSQEDIPHTVAAYIAAAAVLKFQRDYDGDSTKTAQLTREYEQARIVANADNIRNLKVNIKASVPVLVHIKNMARGGWGYRR